MITDTTLVAGLRNGKSKEENPHASLQEIFTSEITLTPSSFVEKIHGRLNFVLLSLFVLSF